MATHRAVVDHSISDGEIVSAHAGSVEHNTPSVDDNIVSDDPIGVRLEAALRECQRRERARGCHPTDPMRIHTINAPTPRAQQKSDVISAA